MRQPSHVIKQSPTLISPAPTSPKIELPSHVSANTNELPASSYYDHYSFSTCYFQAELLVSAKLRNGTGKLWLSSSNALLDIRLVWPLSPSNNSTLSRL